MPIFIVQAATRSVGQQLFSQTPSKGIRPLLEDTTQLGRIVEFSAIWQRARCVNRKLAVRFAPSPNAIEMLKRKTGWIHPLMTRCTVGIRTMLFESLSK